MSRSVKLDDLIDSHGVAEILGLSLPSNVSVYQHRYEDMPKPVIDFGRGRPRLWLRSEMARWASKPRRNS